MPVNIRHQGAAKAQLSVVISLPMIALIDTNIYNNYYCYITVSKQKIRTAYEKKHILIYERSS